MSYKEFNLEDALAGKPVMTKDGDEVTEIVFLAGAIPTSQVIAVIRGIPFLYDKKGTRNKYGSHVDLVMKSTIITKFINIYLNNYNKFCITQKFYNSVKDAIDAKITLPTLNWIAIGIKIEIEEEMYYDYLNANVQRQKDLITK